MKMDETDEKILKNLIVDGRLSARQLALKLGMSTVTILSRIKKLEKEKIILGYASIFFTYVNLKSSFAVFRTT